LWRCVAEHRLRRLPLGRSARLHRRHRSTARSARRSVREHGCATVRARPGWSRHRWFPLSFRSGTVTRGSTRKQRTEGILAPDRDSASLRDAARSLRRSWYL
jgi:hypothetical protein